MPPKDISGGSQISKKRKEHPSSSPVSNHKNKPNGRPNNKRVKIHDARAILTQTSDSALSNGELNLQKFLAVREFEIKALDDGMRRAKGALTTRAFQQVPRDMRRRTASHNVKRVPQRLRERAKREMREDNTPTVRADRRKPASSRGRVRAETARKLGVLAEKKKLVKKAEMTVKGKQEKARLVGRAPRAKTGMLREPERPKARFRKRQIHKTWLPTHMWHAKRAKMTEPKKPLWRFSVPLTSSEKSYRPTHRSGGMRGVVCWDMSYSSTIGLEGTDLALEKVLRGVGIGQDEMWGERGLKWRNGKRTWTGNLTRTAGGERVQIGPATVIWSALEHSAANGLNGEANPGSGDKEAMVSNNAATQEMKSKKSKPRRLIVRIHPAAFLELWDEILQLSKLQRPTVHIEDLRFDIGTIEATGPGSTEALLGILHPVSGSDTHAKTFGALRGVTNPASLPANALLTFSIEDPRLRYPPRQIVLPKPEDQEAISSLLETLSTWPADRNFASQSLFSRDARHKSTRLPSQKAINRRKGLAAPGEFPARVENDPSIPILLYNSRMASSSSAAQGTWTLLAPWKCILPIWYGLMHYPLSSGGNPRFGGIQEIRQVHFEHGKPWFPADYPGTQAGWAWELDERQKRKEEWDRRPKGKRTEFRSLNLGAERKGEIGLGWACDFAKLTDEGEPPQTAEVVTEKILPLPGQPLSTAEEVKTITSLPPFQHLPSSEFSTLLANSKLEVSPRLIATVRITLFSRGVPLSCARIYRLPSVLSSSPPQTNTDAQGLVTASLRSQWLAFEPLHNNDILKFSQRSKSKAKQIKVPIKNTPFGRIALAQSLLQSPPLPYPAPPRADLHPPIPGEEDLIGFVTTGNFNLVEGKGTAIGSVIVSRVLESLKATTARQKGGQREARICVVRNAGETVGRLGIWEVV